MTNSRDEKFGFAMVCYIPLGSDQPNKMGFPPEPYNDPLLFGQLCDRFFPILMKECIFERTKVKRVSIFLAVAEPADAHSIRHRFKKSEGVHEVTVSVLWNEVPQQQEPFLSYCVNICRIALRAILDHYKLSSAGVGNPTVLTEPFIRIEGENVDINEPEEVPSWYSEKPAESSSIENLLSETGLGFPQSYQDFMKRTNGGYGDIPINPGYVKLWPVERLMKFNEKYNVQETRSDLFAFGSNGAGEMLAFNTQNWHVVMVPFIGDWNDDEIELAKDFASFSSLFGAGTWT